MTSISRPIRMLILVVVGLSALILFPEFIKYILNPIFISIVVGLGYFCKFLKTKNKRDLRLAIITGLLCPLLFYCGGLLLVKWLSHAFAPR